MRRLEALSAITGIARIDHTSSVFLMNRDGKFVATIDHKEGQRTALQRLERLL